LTPQKVSGVLIEPVVVDEFSQTDLSYLDYLKKPDYPTLLALIGVQSNQFHRALDLAALARAHGVEHCIIGGPHPMTCDTSSVHGKGISFSLAEAELVWHQIIFDAADGGLRPIYGADQRWEKNLNTPSLAPPSSKELNRGLIPMMGIYPARGCPYRCNFCSVIKIAGQRVRSEPIETTLQSFRTAKNAGIRAITVNSDNFNKHPQAKELLHALIDERIHVPFFVQCDTTFIDDEDFVRLLGRAGCYQVFVGTEAFDREVLRDAKKTQNRPERYADIIEICHANGISTHFSSIIGFPQQTKQSILEHLRIKKALNPSVASFWILVPIPGTEQYEEFLSQGLIWDDNLDHFDGSISVWRHPNLSAGELKNLLYFCYREFFSVPNVLCRAVKQRWFTFPSPAPAILASHSIFGRYTGHVRRQPMSTGIHPVLLDKVADYAQIRRKTFGFDLAPLPRNLQLSKIDEESNKQLINVHA